MQSGAVFSECGKYRYRLWRVWDEDLPKLAFCMLNPSTADEVKNDPTIERCQRRAAKLGFGGVEIINIFAYRSTDPNGLYNSADPVGPENERHVKDVARSADMFICAWGKHGTFLDQGQNILDLIHSTGTVSYVLGVNKDGSPRHPLYIDYNTKPFKFF